MKEMKYSEIEQSTYYILFKNQNYLIDTTVNELIWEYDAKEVSKIEVKINSKNMQHILILMQNIHLKILIYHSRNNHLDSINI